MSRDSLTIKKFDPSHHLGQTNCHLIIGKKNMGKTILVLDLLKQQNLPCKDVYYFGEKCNINPVINDRGYQVFEEYEPSQLEAILDKQATDEAKRHTTIVLDDIIDSQRTLKDDKILQRLLFNARHLNITCIMVQQYPFVMNRDLVSNFDTVFLFKMNLNQHRLYEQYAGVFPTFAYFDKVYNDICGEAKDYTSMVINNASMSSKVEDCIMYYKAEQVEPVKKVKESPKLGWASWLKSFIW